MNKDTLKVGIVGFGRMGQKFCFEFKNNPIWQIKSICDKSEAAIKLAKELYPEVKLVTDEDLIFQDEELDVVCLCTLADARPAQIKKALQAGKHILAEKPVGGTIEEEWEVLRMVEASDRMVGVNIYNRNVWYHKEIQKFIKEGEIGELAIIRLCHMTPGHMPQEGHGPEGPPFHDCGMHYVDVARWYANSEYDTYHAQGLNMWSYNEPWWVQAHGKFKNGVIFDITEGFVYGHLSKDQVSNCYVDIIGTKGTAYVHNDFKNVVLRMNGITRTECITKPYGDKSIDVMVDVFGRSVLAGKNLGFPIVKDSVIASDMAWKMLDNAVKNGCPSIGEPEIMDEIMARRRKMTNGFSLPNWKILDSETSKNS